MLSLFCRKFCVSQHSLLRYIVSRLFKDGKVNWGRIITLLCFGYRLAVTVLERGCNSFFSDIITFLIRFVISEKIAKWIAEQGGWVSDKGLETVI